LFNLCPTPTSTKKNKNTRFYSDPCYYLDNLCVDFRYQRMGIGTALAEWGIESARTERLPVGTEAGPMGVGLYRKLGFEEVGVWRVQIPGGEDIEMPVMRLVV
jgi:GNAT superfamily N-acetyltransferase